MVATFFAGFGLSFSLILAIGAQNAFVLRQGLRRAYVLPVVLTCALSDAILITLGVVGFEWLESWLTGVADIMRWVGAAFLGVYGALSLRSAILGTTGLQAEGNAQTLISAMLTCLMLTWLNPHVYLDTVLLIGSISTQYASKIAFTIGAVTASFAFFLSLGYGARLLAPLFSKPVAWRVLDVLICLVMWAIAIGLILHAPG